VVEDGDELAPRSSNNHLLTEHFTDILQGGCVIKECVQHLPDLVGGDLLPPRFEGDFPG